MTTQRLLFSCLAACCAAFASCSGPNSQILQIQSEKEQLTEVIRSQRTANDALKERADQLAKRLDEAEKELAIAQGRGTRLSRTEPATAPATPNSAPPIREPRETSPSSTPAATAKTVPLDKLPWRPARTGSLPSSSKSSESR